jgi:cellulose synthase/poly-beta-1,6-N-acetylglucosamine synthase-like glycosyltransferase
MDVVFYLLAIVQTLLGVYMVWQGVVWLGFARRRGYSDPGFYTPRVAVLCPCKGIEPGLERNLVALTEFDHKNYEIFFVLASASDLAYSTLKRVAETSRVKAHVLVADKPEGCGEKVNNLRAAIEQLPPEFEVLVFVDSDGRPSRGWLHHMVAPLSDMRVGATTTMRWLFPNRSNLPTALLAAWNAPVVTMLTEKGQNFCWGGGTAIRRSVFEQAKVLELWKNSVSDDYSMTRALAEIGRPIVFLPECLTPSFVETDFHGLLEFTNRQILITKVYAPNTWLPAFAVHLLYVLTFLFGALLILRNLFAARPFFDLATLAFLPLLLAALRGTLRVAAVTELMPAYRAQITREAWIYIVLTVGLPFLYLANFLNSLVTRKVRWRGVSYELVSPEQTRILA